MASATDSMRINPVSAAMPPSSTALGTVRPVYSRAMSVAGSVMKCPGGCCSCSAVKPSSAVRLVELTRTNPSSESPENGSSTVSSVGSCTMPRSGCRTGSQVRI